MSRSDKKIAWLLRRAFAVVLVALNLVLAGSAIGLLASLAQDRLGEPRIVLTVPSIIIMTPGLYAFQTIVMLNQGDVLAAIQAGIGIL